MEQDSAHRRHISAQRINIGLSLMASHMAAHIMHISAHIAHIFPHIGDMRTMPLAHIWHISMQSINMHIIFMSILALAMHCIMVSIHIAMQLRQSSTHRRISIGISIEILRLLSWFGWYRSAFPEFPHQKCFAGTPGKLDR
jgi:hypothetical protein